MRTRYGVIEVSFYMHIIVFSLSVSTLAYGETTVPPTKAPGGTTSAPDTDSWLPSENPIVLCPYYENCADNLCHFNATTTATKSKLFLPDEEFLIACGSLKVDIRFPATHDYDFIGNNTYTCFRYDNVNGTYFIAAEVILNKPDDVKGSQVICMYDGNNCTLQNETAVHLILVAGLPSTCTPFVPPTSDMEPWLPSQDQIVDCPQYFKYCTDIMCHFKGTSTETVRKHFLANDESVITCGFLKVDIIFPVTKDSEYLGNKTYTCFQYVNENGTSFSVAEVILTKPDDVKGNQVICSSNQNNCTLQNETPNQIILVAGFSSDCAPWAHPTSVKRLRFATVLDL